MEISDVAIAILVLVVWYLLMSKVLPRAGVGT
jgi:hypothetical protein